MDDAEWTALKAPYLTALDEAIQARGSPGEKAALVALHRIALVYLDALNTAYGTQRLQTWAEITKRVELDTLWSVLRTVSITLGEQVPPVPVALGSTDEDGVTPPYSLDHNCI